METNNKSRVLMGTLCMLASTICYGFISTISIKALNAGAATETILFDKFLYAAILIWAYIFIKKIPFKIEKNQRTVRDFELWGICKVLNVKAEELFSPNK